MQRYPTTKQILGAAIVIIILSMIILDNGNDFQLLRDRRPWRKLRRNPSHRKRPVDAAPRAAQPLRYPNFSLALRKPVGSRISAVRSVNPGSAKAQAAGLTLRGL
jgi:hypothetical protein